jgi:UDP-N-acetylglucosamine transferase subunit ALG13
MVRRPRGREVHLVASLGGHLELLQALAPEVQDRRRVWITSEGSRAESLRGAGETVRTLPRLDRGSLRPSSLLAGVRLALRERPRLVVTTGAGLAVPFALTARLLGARLVFVETMARVTSGSMTGRLLSRAGAATLVQWPELRAVYPAATVCRPTLLEGVPELGSAEGRGTFVTVGSHDEPFDRLLGAVDRAAAAGVLPEPLTVQYGVSERPPGHGEVLPFVSPERFAAAVRAAAVVVTHGGAGAIATVLRAGKVPLVMARSAARHEHVDDHQVQLVARLEELGVVVQVTGEITPELVRRARDGASWDRTRAADLPSVQEAFRRLLGQLA